jgi:hypothetical protein
MRPPRTCRIVRKRGEGEKPWRISIGWAVVVVRADSVFVFAFVGVSVEINPRVRAAPHFAKGEWHSGLAANCRSQR